MACRILDLTVLYARHLKDVDDISKMKVYVVVSLDGNPSNAQESKSPVDVDGGINPNWSFNVKLYLDERSAQQNRLNIHFKLRSHHRVLGDNHVGEVVVPVKELLDSSTADGEASTVPYPVRMPSGKSKGELHFSYKFSDKLTSKVAAPGHSAAPKADVAIMGYPVPAGSSGSSGAGYLPSSPGAYASPPTPGYEWHGYAQPPPPGYGYYPNQQAQQAPKKNKMGLCPPGPYLLPPTPGYECPPPPPPPPQAGHGYAQPPPPGYVYYPNQQAQQAPKKDKMGLCPPGAYASPPTPGYECPPPPPRPPPAGHGYAQPPPPGNGDYPNQQAQQAPKKNKERLGLAVRAAGLIGGIMGHVADAAGAF